MLGETVGTVRETDPPEAFVGGSGTATGPLVAGAVAFAVAETGGTAMVFVEVEEVLHVATPPTAAAAWAVADAVPAPTWRLESPEPIGGLGGISARAAGRNRQHRRDENQANPPPIVSRSHCCPAGKAAATIPIDHRDVARPKSRRISQKRP